jgi:plasmid stabilization system protein ParE
VVGPDESAVEAEPRGDPLVTYQTIMLPRAKSDAADIDAYLAANNPAAADRFAHNLEQTLRLQASIPTPGSSWLSKIQR